jgi:catechol 2,3-dioxygenase-like lactoylglutathione lyase family enzyme
MITGIDKVTVWIRDEEDALKFYTEKLGFEKRMDVSMPEGPRWVTVGPRGGGGGPELILHNPLAWHSKDLAHRMMEMVGKTTGTVLLTDDCRQTCGELAQNGVTIISQPALRPYGVEAVFADLYGNTFVLVERV